MNAVELNGAGGYEPGIVGRSIERELDDEEETGLLRLVDGAKLFEQPSLTCELGLDGARWIVEGIDREAYHFIDRWSPEQGPVHDFGLYALELTGWDVGEIY